MLRINFWKYIVELNKESYNKKTKVDFLKRESTFTNRYISRREILKVKEQTKIHTIKENWKPPLILLTGEDLLQKYFPF